MTSAGSFGGDGRLRLFLALELAPETLDVLVRWGGEHLTGGRVVPRQQLHVTLAFLGSRPVCELEAIVAALRAAVADRSGPIELEPTGWRETRSVGMVALDDLGDEATRLAVACMVRSSRSASTAGVATLAAARHRAPLPRATAARAAAPGDGNIRSVRRGCLPVSYCTRPEPGTRCWNVSR